MCYRQIHVISSKPELLENRMYLSVTVQVLKADPVRSDRFPISDFSYLHCKKFTIGDTCLFLATVAMRCFIFSR